MEEIIKTINSLSGKYSSSIVFDDWVTMMAMSISNMLDFVKNDVYKKREQQYINIAKKYNKDEINKFVIMFAILIELFENDIDDFLGKIYMKCDMRK